MTQAGDMQRAAVVVFGLLCVCAGGTALADSPVVHEYVPDVDPNEAVLMLRRARGESAQVVYGGELLDVPDLDSGGVVPTMSGRPDDGVGAARAGQRSPSFRPDRLTQLEGELVYFSAFNPVVAPFKRVTSLDRVVIASDGRTPVLTVAEPRRTSVAIESPDDAAPDARPRDRFWGEVELNFDSGRAVPLPSVAPDSRILTLRTKPELRISIQRDGADNYYAVAGGPVPAGSVRMAYLIDAPQRYFGVEIPQLEVGALAAEVPPMPDSVRRDGLLFAAELGLSTRSDLREVIHVLTGHFRAFEESAEPPPDTGNIFLDLARAKRGICRHRTYAFVLTAQSLGVPARFVMNEAHSFVEVALPRHGWMRIDLGGAAHGLTAHGARNRPLYRPVEPDRLPRPPAYVRGYSQLGDNTVGLRPPGAEQMRGRWIEPEAGFGATTGLADVGETGAGQAVVHDSGRVEPGDARRMPLRLQVDQTRSSAMRGEQLVVSGSVSDARGSPRPGLRIEISLAAADRTARLLLGVTVTDAAGGYRVALGLPADLPVGDYRLVVVTPGDADYLPATAE